MKNKLAHNVFAVEQSKGEIMSAIKKPKMPNEGFVEAIPRPDNISLFPSRGIDKAAPEEPKRSWWFRRAVEAGFIAMPNTQPKTPGFYVNWSTVSGVLLILGAMAGICLWLWNVAYNQGAKDKENQQLINRIEKAEEEAQKAKDLQLLNDKGHPSPQPEKKK